MILTVNNCKSLMKVLIIVTCLLAAIIYILGSSSLLQAYKWQQLNIDYYDSEVWKNTHFLGVSTQQNPCDMQQMQEIFFSIKPDIIIETGTLHGGSALYYATIMDQIKPKSKIITIDIDPHTEEASKHRVWMDHVTSLKGSSTDPAIIDQIKKQIFPGAIVLVTLDSDHSRDHVYKELKIYSPLVTLGSYLVVQDTNINGHPVLKDFGPGPMEALNDFQKDNHDFETDKSKEKFFLTFFPNGWLKRVR